MYALAFDMVTELSHAVQVRAEGLKAQKLHEAVRPERARLAKLESTYS